MRCGDWIILNYILTEFQCDVEDLNSLIFFTSNVSATYIKICGVIDLAVATIGSVVCNDLNNINNVVNTILTSTWNSKCRVSWISKHSSNCFFCDKLFVCSQKFSSISISIGNQYSLTNVRVSSCDSKCISTVT